MAILLSSLRQSSNVYVRFPVFYVYLSMLYVSKPLLFEFIQFEVERSFVMIYFIVSR